MCLLSCAFSDIGSRKETGLDTLLGLAWGKERPEVKTGLLPFSTISVNFFLYCFRAMKLSFRFRFWFLFFFRFPFINRFKAYFYCPDWPAFRMSSFLAAPDSSSAAHCPYLSRSQLSCLTSAASLPPLHCTAASSSSPNCRRCRWRATA